MNMHFVLVDCSNYTADRIVLSNPLRVRCRGSARRENSKTCQIASPLTISLSAIDGPTKFSKTFYRLVIQLSSRAHIDAIAARLTVGSPPMEVLRWQKESPMDAFNRCLR